MNPQVETPDPSVRAAALENERSSASKRTFYIVLAVAAVLLLVMFMRSRGKKPVPTGAGADGKAALVAAPTPVQVALVKTGAIDETVQVSGEIAALTEVNLASKLTARVVDVKVREGDSVQKGQLVVSLDTSDLDSQVRSAQAQLQSARSAVVAAEARLGQAKTGLRLQQRSYAIGVNNAQEGLRSAQARLELVQKGARRQERLQAQSGVNVAQANLDDAQTNYDRAFRLYNEGATAKSNVDTAETRVRVSRAQLQNARQAVSLLQEGARPEEITQQEAAVESARQALAQANDNQRQVVMKQQDVSAARAALNQTQSGVRAAQAGVALAQQLRSNAFVHSPVNGIVAKRTVEQGQIATMGTPLLRITVPGTVYFSAEIPERDVERLRVGQTVRAQVDAFPGVQYTGRVDRIYPTGDSANRTFTARITLNDQGRLRAGMFARGMVEISSRSNVTLVPKAALAAAGSVVPLGDQADKSSQATIFVPQDGKAMKRTITVGEPTGDNVEVLSGLQPGDRVIVSGSRLEDGAKIAVGPASAASPDMGG